MRQRLAEAKVSRLQPKPIALIIFALLLGWITALVAGFFVLLNYKATPGEEGSAAANWPVEGRIERVPGRFNLVIALHPHCPCSRASVAELQRILARSGEDVQVHALVYRPSSAGDGWEDSGMLSTVKSIPGILIHVDEDAKESARFGARTSGQVVLFGPNGDLLFCGGITSSRGHEGETPAHESIHRLLSNESSALAATPVYGCPFCNNHCDQEKK